MQPIVSIIVPIYNTAEYLPRCIESLLAQTLRDLEIVCVDDGSTDGSDGVLREYASKDPRLVALFQENHGVEWARAAAMERARGRYIMFCDSDDAYKPQMCERMLAAVEANGTDLAICGFDPLGGLEPHYEKYATPTASDHAPFLARGNVWLWNKVFKREVLDRTGLAFPKDPRIRRGYDGVFTFLYSLAVGDATFLSDHLVEHYKRDGSITSFRRGGKLRSTLDDAAHLPRILEFVDRNGFYPAKADAIFGWIDFKIGLSFKFCNPEQRTEAIRLFSEALSSRSADIKPEYKWLCAVLAHDEEAVARLLKRSGHRGALQRIADAITIVLEWLGLRVWLKNLLFKNSSASE